MNTIETIPAFIDTFFANVRHKINIDFKTFKLENFKYDITLRRQLGEIKPLPPQFEKDVNKQTLIRSRLHVKMSHNHIVAKYQNQNTQVARIPFPDDPINIIPNKHYKKQELDISFRSDQLYPKAPIYFIDFSKYFSGGMSKEIIGDRYEVDPTSYLHGFVVDFMKGFSNIPEIAFPVFYLNKYSSPQKAKMEIFGLLRYMKNELDLSVKVDLFVYQLNFTEFKDIWEETKA